MTDQHGTRDLHRILDAAAGAGPVTTDVRPDLLRGRRALARTRRRRGATGLVGVAAAGVVGLGAADQLSHHSTPTARAYDRSTATQPAGVAAIVLRDASIVHKPYTFDKIPDGWSVEGQSPSAATFVPPTGHVDPDPDVFSGKLVVLYDQEGLIDGRRVTRDGRTFSIGGDSGYTTVSTSTLPGEPDGTIRAQFPDATGWSDALMMDFLAGVHVGAGAQPGVG